MAFARKMLKSHSNTGEITIDLAAGRRSYSGIAPFRPPANPVRGYDPAMERSTSAGHKKLSNFVTAILVLCTACAPSNAPSDSPEPRELTIFAAASLQDLVSDLAEELQSTHQIPVSASFAGSNTLAQQILAAPGADLFLSADRLWVDRLESAGRLLAGSRREVLGNRLVLVARRDSSVRITEPHSLIDASYRHLALGDPDAVPAGRYARTTLEHLGIWNQLSERVIPSPDVRAALALVESDPEILSIVYQTDAMSSQRVSVLLEFDAVPGQEITYHAAIVQDGSNPAAAQEFLESMDSYRGRELILKHGFLRKADK